MWGDARFNIALPTEVSEHGARWVVMRLALQRPMRQPSRSSVLRRGTSRPFPWYCSIPCPSVSFSSQSPPTAPQTRRLKQSIGVIISVSKFCIDSGMWASHSFLLMPPTTCHTWLSQEECHQQQLYSPFYATPCRCTSLNLRTEPKPKCLLQPREG